MKQKNGGTRSSQAIRSLRPFVHNASIFFEHHNDAKALSNLERFSRIFQEFFFFQASLRNCINCVRCDDHFFIFIFPESYEERRTVKEGENEPLKSKKKTNQNKQTISTTTKLKAK